jgi:hypothetical protein
MGYRGIGVYGKRTFITAHVGGGPLLLSTLIAAHNGSNGFHQSLTKATAKPSGHTQMRQVLMQRVAWATNEISPKLGNPFYVCHCWVIMAGSCGQPITN